MSIINIVLFFIIGTVPLLYGAIEPWVWAVYAVLMMGVFGIAYWQGRVRIGGPWVLATAGGFLVYSVFLCVPLPGFLLELLSPERYGLLKAGSGLLGGAVGWESLSYDWLAASAWAGLLFAVLLFFFVLKGRLEDKGLLRQMAWVMLAVAFAEALYGLVQLFVPGVEVLWSKGIGAEDCARGTFINRNHFAGFLGMVWPLGLGLIIYQAKKHAGELPGSSRMKRLKWLFSTDWFGRQFILVFAMVLIILALLFSRSRAGITAAFIGFCVFLVLLRLGRRRIGPGMWAFGGAGFCLLFVYSLNIGLDSIFERFLKLSDGASRVALWRESFGIVKDHPLGIGLHNYAEVFPVYDSLSGITGKYYYAHNDYLQLLIETGWPGFVLIMAGFLFFLGKSITRIYQAGRRMDDFRFLVGIGALSGVISMAFHSVFDFNLQIPANLLYFVVLCGIVWGCFWGKYLDRSA